MSVSGACVSTTYHCPLPESTQAFPSPGPSGAGAMGGAVDLDMSGERSLMSSHELSGLAPPVGDNKSGGNLGDSGGLTLSGELPRSPLESQVIGL